MSIRPRALALWLLASSTAAFIGCTGGDDDDDSPTPTPSPTPFNDEIGSWDNATVYFIITDRFLDGDPSNNGAYGREPDGGNETGTFHGGDLRGIIEKLETGYFNRLGVSALWITAPYEQIHGWVVGGANEFKHYAYHGYYALDYTRMDESMGTEEDLTELVDKAHGLGIRVLLDVVMNHPGYAAIQDLAEFGVDVLKPGYENATLADYHSYIDYQDEDFADWWGVNWIRAGLGGGYDRGGSDDLTKGVASLPDFKTESTEIDIGLPVFYANKPDTRAVENPDYNVRDYLVEWLTDWVAAHGIDGFRCDTAKHVEKEAWAELKEAGHVALQSWREANPEKALPDEVYADPDRPFWMVGEVYPHGVVKDAYFDNGFDALINFNFQPVAGTALTNLSGIDSIYQGYADALNPDPDFNMLSYLSSHDTYLFFSQYAGKDLEKQKLGGALLMLAPGAVQIFYGDENARPPGPTSTDPQQPTRSDYAWGANEEVLEHWRKLGRFRRRHDAVGAGAHAKVADAPYTFKRTLEDDVIYAALGASGTVQIDVSADFTDGTMLREFYTGAQAAVSSGTVSFEAHANGVLLIERAP